METLIRKIATMLRKHFRGCEVELETNSRGRISGFLMWNGFKRFEQIERQEKMWKLLRTNLAEKDQLKVSAIFTLTPEEMAFARQG
jgi:hypothetical protein